MNEKPLTPTYARSHAPAKQLLQGKASLKSLLSLDDVKFLIGGHELISGWTVGATKNSAVDRFLSSLAIRDWDIEQFIHLLEEKVSSDTYLLIGADKSFIAWLSGKSDAWLQKFYALLADDYLTGSDYNRRLLIEKLKPLNIVRISNRVVPAVKALIFKRP